MFALADLDGDGLISEEEFVIIGLNQFKFFGELPPEKEKHLEALVLKRFREMSPSSKPISFFKYKAYIKFQAELWGRFDVKAMGKMASAVSKQFRKPPAISQVTL